MALIGLNKVGCVAACVGNTAFYYAEKAAVEDFIIDPVTLQVTDIVMDATADCPVFVEYTGANKSMNYSEELIPSSGNCCSNNMKQTTTFDACGRDEDTKKAVDSLKEASCCGMYGVRQDCSGNLEVLGISINKDGSWSTGVSCVELTALNYTSGADPEADTNGYSGITLESIVACSAPTYTGVVPV